MTISATREWNERIAREVDHSKFYEFQFVASNSNASCDFESRNQNREKEKDETEDVASNASCDCESRNQNREEEKDETEDILIPKGSGRMNAMNDVKTSWHTIDLCMHAYMNIYISIQVSCVPPLHEFIHK